MYEELIKAMRKSLASWVFTLDVVGRHQLPVDSGVYFVCEGYDIVYIGKACDLYKRWKGHKFRRDVDAGRFQLRFKLTSDLFANAEQEESLLILALTPRFNSVVNCSICVVDKTLNRAPDQDEPVEPEVMRRAV